MFIDGMSAGDIAREARRDMPYLHDWVYKKYGKFVREFHKGRLPLGAGISGKWISRYTRNTWGVSLRAQDDGYGIFISAKAWCVYGERGRHAVISKVTGEADRTVVIHVTPHYMSRFRERMGLPDADTDTLMEGVIESLSRFGVWTESQTDDGNIMLHVRGGVAFERYDRDVNVVTMKTFVSEGMMLDGQLMDREEADAIRRYIKERKSGRKDIG